MDSSFYGAGFVEDWPWKISLLDIRNRWIGKTIPYPHDKKDLYGQCVQLIRYCLDIHYKKPQWGLLVAAADFWHKYNDDYNIKTYWDKMPYISSFVPIEGDICIWDYPHGGVVYGHIGIVFGKEQSAKQFTCLESNWSRRLKVTVETHNQWGVLGFFRLKKKEGE